MKKLLILPLLIAFVLNVKAQSKDVTLLGQLGYNDQLNDVWGWADPATGDEYALVGLVTGLSVVDVTTPSNPQEVLFIPGVYNTWRDMKTWGNYAYTIHEENTPSDGILILDMTTVNDAFPTTYNVYPTVTINGNTQQYKGAHNLYIDENGILYVFGANIGVGGALMFDLKPDPTDPTYVGIFDQYYLHDGVARGDTLWGAAITSGFFSAISVLNKNNPQEMFSKTTPYNYAHNVWFSDDNQRVFTTDERPAAYIAEYDVSDFNNITKLDQLRTSFGNNVIPHNTHFHNNFLVNSYYTSGLQIVDVSEPGIMVETAYYDTSPTTGGSFSGAWGAYPYLPSGNILVSDRGEGLFVLSSTYPRAAFFAATVIDSVSPQTLLNADIDFINGNMQGSTDIFGTFKDGQMQGGTYTVVASKSGYYNDTLQVTLTQGNVSNRQFELVPLTFSAKEYGSLSGISLFPNPATDQVSITNIQTGIDELEYELVDMTGAVHQRGVLETASGQCKLSLDKSPGYYFLRLKYENEAPVSLKISIK